MGGLGGIGSGLYTGGLLGGGSLYGSGGLGGLGGSLYGGGGLYGGLGGTGGLNGYYDNALAWQSLMGRLGSSGLNTGYGLGTSTSLIPSALGTSSLIGR
jgi:hypothetical protein